MARINDGIVIGYKNDTGSDIAAGDVVAINEICGIAAEGIANGELGQVYVTGVYSITKGTATDVIEQGKVIVHDSGAKVISAGTTIVDAVVIGKSVAKSTSAQTTVDVRLGL